jgi:SAM-dependent methyltransferase
MSAPDVRHYDREAPWQQLHAGPGEAERVAATVEMVPAPAQRVVDVGAGNGLVTLPLRAAGHDVVAFDLAPTPLSTFTGARAVASADALPLSSSSVDGAVCTEVVEHLPGPLRSAALAEMARVARSWVVLSVPNDEVLESIVVRCADCGCTFHPWRHAGRFRSRDIEELLSEVGFVLDEARAIGPETRYPPQGLARLAQAFGGYMQPSAGSALCPACGNGTRFERRVNPMTLALRTLPGRLARPRPYWILARYRRAT